MHLPSNPLSLMGPAILLVFAGCFLLLWYTDRKRRYILSLAVAILLFVLGSMSQITGVPPAVGTNALVSASLYLTSAFFTCRALLARSDNYFPVILFSLIFIGVLTGIAYYFYVDRNLLARIYILNFGIGTIFVITVFRLSGLRRGSYAEAMLFWVFVAFSIQFFIRTVLTAERLQNTGHGYGYSIFWSALQLSLAVFGVALALAILAVVVSDKLLTIERDRSTDHLTGLLNRRGLEERATRLPRVLTNAPGAVLIADIDHFKRVNDQFGHAAGDAVIRRVGDLIRERTEGVKGIAGRFGGEEFVMLLPATDQQNARRIAEEVRSGIAKAIVTAGRFEIAVTVSIGVHFYSHMTELEEPIRRADEALYYAKRGGRNSVAVSGEIFCFETRKKCGPLV